MKGSLSTWRNSGIYFSGLLLFLCAGFLLLFLDGKSASFISLNAYHPFWLNVFFINYTFVGDGIFAIALIGLCLFYFRKKQQGLAFLYAFLVSGVAVQIIKNLINSPRPRLFFEPGRYLYFVDHVSLANNSSFPSGHTATAFAIATVLILMMKNKKWQLPVLIAAILVGYSRIYLAQHFLVDVLIGAIIGSASGLLAFSLAKNMKGLKLSFRKLHTLENNRTITSPGTIQTA